MRTTPHALLAVLGTVLAASVATALDPTRPLGLFSHQAARRYDGTGWFLFLGSAIFSGTLFGLALGGPKWLGAVTPVGGSLLILGFLVFAVQAPRH